MSNLRFGMAALALAFTVGSAVAQTTSPTPGTAPADKPAQAETTTPPVAGANSFTESQARDRIAKAGFQEVKDLKKDDQGIWRGKARKGDTQVNVALDFRGNVVQE